MPTPFNRLARGESYPGTCLRCKRDADLVDLGAADIPGYGTVYLCWVCVGELFDTFEMIPKRYSDHLQKESEQKIGALEERLDLESKRQMPALVQEAELAHVADLLDRARGALLGLADGNAAAGAVGIAAVPRVGAERGDQHNVFVFGDGSNAGDVARAVDAELRKDDGRDGGDPERGDVWDALGAPVPDEADR